MAYVELPQLTKPTLEDAIRALREPVPVNPEVQARVLRQRVADVANDLAMLHGLIEAREDEFEAGQLADYEESQDDAEFRTSELADEDTIAEVIALNERAELAEHVARGGRPPFYRPREYDDA